MSRRGFIQTMIALASASLGLVAALAWNEAIKATLALLRLGESLAGLYTYAILATVVAAQSEELEMAQPSVPPRWRGAHCEALPQSVRGRDPAAAEPVNSTFVNFV